VALLAVTLLGFGGYAIIQTVLPLYAVHLGASTTVVGVLILAFSIPSVLLRPTIGALVDGWSRRGVHLVGTACLGLIGFFYVIPSLVTLLAVRVVHGAGWAAFNTAGGTAVAVLAPPPRRGEASGIYNLMPGLANMVMPALSVVLLSTRGFAATFIVAGMLGLVAAATLRATPFPGERTPASRPSLPEARAAAGLERHAILPMGIEFLFTITYTLFWVYPPVFAASLGIPIEAMIGYYVPVGIAVVASRLAMGRVIDRLGRRTALLLGAAAVTAGLVVASSATTIVPLAIAGSLHALAASLITPTAMAIAIDGSSVDRRGASIATYSLGFQLGVGVGGLSWGAAIDAVGFSWTYLLALIGPLAILTIVLRSTRLGRRPRAGTW